MAWDMGHVKMKARYVKRFSVFNADSLGRDAPLGEAARMAVDREWAKLGHEGLVAAHVVPMVVRVEDGDELEALGGENLEHGLGLGGINDDSVVSPLGNDQIRIVITETGDRNHAHGSHPNAF